LRSSLVFDVEIEDAGMQGCRDAGMLMLLVLMLLLLSVVLLML